MPADVVLDRRARPSGAQRLVIGIAAILAGIAGCWLARAIDSAASPGWTIGLVVGGLIAALVWWFAMLGTRVVVDPAGILVYSLQGRPNLRFDLRATTAIRMVSEGLAQGVGIEFADPRAVRFLHKSGISPERMRRWRESVGVDLVLEGFPADLAGELLRLRTALPPAGAGAAAAGP